MRPAPTLETFVSTRLVVLVADLSGYHRAYRTHTDEEVVRFLDRFYALCEHVVTGAGGRVVKFLGDAVLAVFEPDDAVAAVDATVALETLAARLADEEGFDLALGANLHVGPVVAAELGAGASRRPDVIGRAVNQTFLLGGGRGLRLSEPMYRKLPSGDRTPWQRHKPPAVYLLQDDGITYADRISAAAHTRTNW